MRLAFLIAAFSISASLRAQDCTDFLLPQYETWAEMDVVYGTAERYNGTTATLAMNIFKPVGDENTQRPLLIMVHGGGFHEGNRNQMNELCQWYAARGYVAATISYRLGFHHVLAPVFPVDIHELVRAMYRGMQDCRGAIRFLKERADVDSADVNRVAVLGGSAGGFIALHTAYMDQPDEKPSSAGSLGPVLLSARPDLGPIEGTMNLNGWDTDVQAAVNIFGGMRDTSLITSPLDPPVYAYHQSQDPVVHCNRMKPYWALVPDANNPLVDGSCAIQAKTTMLNFPEQHAVFHIYDGNEHEVHDIELVDQEIAAFLNYHLCQVATSIEEEENSDAFTIFPNPTSGMLNIESNRPLQLVELYDMAGNLSKTFSFNQTDNVRIDTSGLPRGMYVARLWTDAGVYHQKIILR